MALSRNEIRKRLSAFAKEQQHASNERSQAQTFWLRFYECFGIRAESATIYEQSVKKLGGAQGFIDSFIPASSSSNTRARCWRAFKTDHLCALNFDQAFLHRI